MAKSLNVDKLRTWQALLLVEHDDDTDQIVRAVVRDAGYDDAAAQQINRELEETAARAQENGYIASSEDALVVVGMMQSALVAGLLLGGGRL